MDFQFFSGLYNYKRNVMEYWCWKAMISEKYFGKL